MDKTITCLRCGSEMTYKEKDENFFGKCRECGHVCALNKDYNEILHEVKFRRETCKIYECIMVVALFSSIAAMAFQSWSTKIFGIILFGVCCAVEFVYKRYKENPRSTQKMLDYLKSRLRCNDREGWYVLREEDRVGEGNNGVAPMEN